MWSLVIDSQCKYGCSGNGAPREREICGCCKSSSPFSQVSGTQALMWEATEIEVLKLCNCLGNFTWGRKQKGVMWSDWLETEKIPHWKNSMVPNVHLLRIDWHKQQAMGLKFLGLLLQWSHCFSARFALQKVSTLSLCLNPFFMLPGSNSLNNGWTLEDFWWQKRSVHAFDMVGRWQAHSTVVMPGTHSGVDKSRPTETRMPANRLGMRRNLDPAHSQDC